MNILDLIWPPFCVGCKKDTSNFNLFHRYLCPQCLGKIESWDEKRCPRCNKGKLENFFLCKKCKERSFLKGIVAASSYENPILRKALHVFKYQGVANISLPVGRLVAQKFYSFLQTQKDRQAFPSYLDYLLVPVPLSKRRERKRGFNQARILANLIHAAFEIPINPDIIKRKKSTRPQREIKEAKKRKANIKGVFAFNTKITPRMLRGKKVFIVDDITTTGATLEECAKVLKPYCREIWGLVVAA